MKQRFFLLSTVFVVAFAWLIAGPAAYAAEPIVIGVPTSLGFLEGKESHKAVQIAVTEINAKGGVNIGGTKRPLKVVAADLRDAAPGVPVPEALLGSRKNDPRAKACRNRCGALPVRSPDCGNGPYCQI